MNTCPFCGDSRKLFLKQQGYPSDRMYFYEDEEYSISPDLSPLVTGHLLVIPRKHYASFGELADSGFITKVIEKGKKLLGTDDVLVFEHGAVIEGEGGASIDHAHLHIMPRPTNVTTCLIDDYILNSREITESKIIYTPQKLHELYVQQKSYIFYWLLDKGYIYPVRKISHQFLRLMMQPFCQLSYNWRETFKTQECRTNVENTISLIESIRNKRHLI